jgi:hypothetical protein
MEDFALVYASMLRVAGAGQSQQKIDGGSLKKAKNSLFSSEVYG